MLHGLRHARMIVAQRTQGIHKGHKETIKGVILCDLYLIIKVYPKNSQFYLCPL